MTTLLEPDHVTDHEPVKAKRWAAVFFDTEGRSVVDDISFEKREQAEAEGNKVVAESKGPRKFSWLEISGIPFCKGCDLSHAIPMPVGDA